MNQHLFRFGFQRPQYLGTDLEDSTCIWIVAVDSQVALEWGRCVAEAFISSKYPGLPSWKDGDFAHWIETDSKVIEEVKKLHFPTVRVGALPDPWPDF